MARPLSDPQRQEIAVFVTALYQLGGYATQKEFADDTGYHPVNLSDVMGGKSGIDGLNLIKLIKAAGRRAGKVPLEAALEAAATPREPLRPAEDARREELLRRALEALREVLEMGQ